MDRRFFVQHQTADAPPGANWTHSFDSWAEAEAACDEVWDPEVRQEVSDATTGQILVRSGNVQWRPQRVVRPPSS